MAVKLYKRSRVTANTLLYVLLSVVFLHIILSLSRGSSALDLSRFLEIFKDQPYIAVLGLLSFFAVMQVRNISKILLLAFASIIIFESFLQFFHEFDKFILVLAFCYFLITLYVFIVWSLELQESVYCPCFSHETIGRKSMYHLNVMIEFGYKEKANGHLTNWHDESCFIILKEKFGEVKGTIKFIIDFEGKRFIQKGEVVSCYGKGIGVKFFLADDYLEDGHDIFGWREFFTILSDRGYLPQLL
ncbi:MAG: hypothetical protein ISR65_00450 [Bacteriovoracaceae bacterium]|nr:hypothetical protein [Bacteriovoracaceae bacterium]